MVNTIATPGDTSPHFITRPWNTIPVCTTHPPESDPWPKVCGDALWCVVVCGGGVRCAGGWAEGAGDVGEEAGVVPHELHAPEGGHRVVGRRRQHPGRQPLDPPLGTRGADGDGHFGQRVLNDAT